MRGFRGLRAAAWIWIFSLVTALPAPGLDGPTLSRYSVSLLNTGPVFVKLDSNVVNEFCHDEDGCDVILSMENATSVNFETQRVRLHLALAGNDTSWSASGGGSGTDGNTVIENVARVTESVTSCTFSDADNDVPTDTDSGFSLHLLAFVFETKQCNLVLID